jgi:4-diphosphocytidyl-2-C-methyl-D-erythritol kinase
MIAFPPCKINLGLTILRKRADGYHDIETCFYPVSWTDILEIIKSGEFTFAASGLPIPGDPSDNLCVRAFRMIEREFSIGPVAMHLHKIIPAGAGLGGGSSDAAHTLKLLNRIFELDLTDERLEGYASQLGSDCSFFIRGKPAVGTERGNRLTPLEANPGDRHLIVVAPGIHIPTAAAYLDVHPYEASKSCADIVSGLPLWQWKDHLKNDFEKSVVARYPEIGRIKELLYEAGAVYASMSGSGSAVFGIFDKATQTPAELGNYRSWCGPLSV